VDDDDDDYEPDFHMAEDTEQILNKLDNAPPKDAPPQAKEIVLSTFTMPAPEPMTAREAAELGRSTVTRVFGMMQTLEEPALKKAKAGINRLAASTNDRDAWITVLTRLATRSVAGLEDEGHDEGPKLENGGVQNPSLSNTIREALYMYVLEDFRKRIDVAVSWLSEEWYSDRIQIKIGNESSLHYDKWVLRVLDGFIPYLDARDKVLTRFLSEVPAVNIQLLDRVKGLCRDPAMVNLALTSLLYLVMMKPPARDIALDAVQEIWSTCK
jgi:symplekin